MAEYNASDTKSIRKAAKAAKQAEAERRLVVFNLLSSPAGRAYVYERLVRCHIFSSSFSSSAMGMAFAEGERNVGLQELNDIMQFAPDQYVQLMREANERRVTDNDLSQPGGRGANNGRADSGSGSEDGGTVHSDYDPSDDSGAEA